MKKKTLLLLISLLSGSAFLQPAWAVVPAPDGGYPNFNTAEGQNALFSLTNGSANTAVGWFSLKTDSTGSFNTGVGAGTLALNTGDENTAIGAAALLLNTGNGNTAVGSRALLNNAAGIENVGCGHSALLQNTNGRYNTAVGIEALSSNTEGLGNVAIGSDALSFNSTGNSNVAIGVNAGLSVTTANNVICIGNLVSGGNADNSCYVGNIWTQPGGSQAVFVDANGKLGAQVSSRRFKEEIKPIDEASGVIFALKPVSFRYKKEIDPTRAAQFGLVAEDVAKVNPDLVIRDRDGKPYTVRYDQVNAMLLNEFLKEHKTVQEQECRLRKQEATIAIQQKQIDALTAGLQKVSAELELGKSLPQTVSNEQ